MTRADVTRTEVQRVVRAAVDAGQLPAGGPSEAAAYGLLDDLPPGYWQRWAEAAADRIRAKVARGGTA